jgi:hypothetical protein
MAGKVKIMIERIIKERAKGNATIEMTTRTKIILKGVNIDQWTALSNDDPTIISKVTQIAKDLGVNL